MRVGPKYERYLRHHADGEVLEGTTAAGKTTVGALKFMMRVARSNYTQHILAGLDLGTIEKNIINKPHGILDELGDLVEYRGGGSSGNSMPHLVLRYGGVERVVYVLGYADKARWKKALGGQYGCLFVDEANVADMDFVREAVMRCEWFLMTLNPDDPDLPIYSEYVNRATPMCDDAPEPILAALTGERPNWAHWFFGFEDNVSLTPEKVATIKANVPEGTKLWKNKVLGLRGRATGLVFPTYDPARHDMGVEEARRLLRTHPDWQRGDEELATLTSGLDTSYSAKSADTISMTFGGITDRGRFVLLGCEEHNNRGRQVPLAPTDCVRLYAGFLERMRGEWGLARHAFVDSADQATLMELRKWRRGHPEFLTAFEAAHKRLPNIDRIELQLGWMGRSDPAFRIVADRCAPYVRELGAYSWSERDSAPEDGNDHSIQSCQYAWLPYRERIGR